MAEWWSYSLSSFLLFSPKAYYRLFELYNRDCWPAQLVALALGAVLLACLFGRAPWRGRVAAATLAACWLWVAWAFLAERYASINWAASYFALGFAAEALLLLWAGALRNALAGPANAAGIGLCAFALFAQPLLGPLLGRPWQQIEIFGMMPDPTVAATLGVLVAAQRAPWLLWPIPLLWCLLSGATQWAMGAQEAWLMPAIALLASLAAVLAKHRGR